ncbi:MAG: hypothetical protein ACNS60_09050 [Candidatus Cyclobacteriaceae bacterium M2_1C_046]
MTRIISIVLLLVSLGLAGYLVYSVKDTIDSKELIAKRERQIIDRLELIREAEIAYQEYYGHYTDNWDSLINFIKTAQVPITQRSETIITLAYGADSVVVEIDTIGFISARDRIFTATHNVDAADDGILRRIFVKEGDQVNTEMKAYALEGPRGTFDHKFKQSGTVTNIEPVQPGDSVDRGDLLMTLEEYRFNPNVNLDRLAYVPGYEDVKFEIYADEITKGNVKVDVIEVKNPKPFDPNRSEENEALNRKPLKFGSRTEVTTSGNWE